MSTTKPLSTIAYDELVLCKTLTDLLNKGIVSFFCYINHYGEGEGLSEGKNHIHCYVEFNKLVDPLEFKWHFVNDVGNSTVLNWRRSQFADWYYYVLHDPEYLASKGLVRQFEYDRENVQASDLRELDQLIINNPRPNCSRVRSAILNGVSEREMFLQGILTPQNVSGVTALNSIINPPRNEKIMQGFNKKKGG